MRIFLGALVLVLALATACSGGGDGPEADPTSARASEETAPEKPPRRRLRAAQRALAKLTHGVYELTVWSRGLHDPLLRERGRFDVPHEVYEIVRTIQNVGAEESDPSSYVMRVRASARTRFMQMEDWGVADGCWLEIGDETLAELIGVDLPNFPEIPVPVSLVMDSRLQKKNRQVLHQPPGDTGVVTVASTAPAAEELRIVTDGYTALQTLGISGSKLIEVDPRAERMKVPVTASFFRRHPDVIERLQIQGEDVLRAARAADVELDQTLRPFIQSMVAQVVFSRGVIQVERFEPAAELLIPRDTGGACPANQD